MKKLLAMILCLALAVGLCAGCGGNQSSGGSDVDEQGRTTIKIGIPRNMNVEDYETNALTLWLEEQTGLNLEFQLFMASEADYRSQLSTMFIDPSVEMPDLLWRFRGLGTDTIEMYGADGYFMDVSDYLMDREKSANFWELFDKLDPDFQARITRLMTEQDGAIYSIPSIETSDFDTINYKVFINQTWLDTLNLEMPTDTESLYNVLVAFRDGDPNGNGKKDELPLIGRAGSGGADVVNWIMNMFEYVDNRAWWNVDENGKLTCPYTTDAYREGLKYCRKLVDEGLMQEAVYSMSSSEVKSLLNPTNGICTVGVWVDHPTSYLEVDHDSVYDYAAMPYWGNAVRLENKNVYDMFVTETGAEKIDDIWKLLMCAYTEEAAIRMRYGQKDVDWVDADEGAKSYLGYDAKVKVINEDAYVGVNNQTWHTISGTILLNAENETCQIDDSMSDWIKAKMKLMTDCYNNFCQAEENNNPENIFTGMVYPEDESEATQHIRNNVRDVFTNMSAKFICGTDGADPTNDKQWQDYLDEIQEQGYQEYYEQAQRLYDDLKK